MLKPTPNFSEVVVSDPSRASAWRFQSSSAPERWEQGGVEAFEWSDGNWIHRRTLLFGAPICDGALLAYLDTEAQTVIVGALDEAGRRLALFPITAHAPSRVVNVPFPLEGGANMSAVHVAGHGTLMVFSPTSGDEGWTCVLSDEGLRVIARNPWVRALTHDPSEGVVATGFSTYILRRDRWEELADESQSSPVFVEGVGLVGLVWDDSGEAMALARIVKEPGEPVGYWAAFGGGRVRMPVSGAHLAHIHGEDAILVVGGQQGPHMELTPRTHVLSDWRSNAETGEQGARTSNEAFTVSLVAQHGVRVVGYDPVRSSILGFENGRWQPVSTFVDMRPSAMAVSERCAYLFEESGQLIEWSGQWRQMPGHDQGPGARHEPALLWDGLQGRLLLHGGFQRNDTWMHDGYRWTPLGGGRLPHGVVSMVSTPNGVYALANLRELFLLTAHGWQPLQVPPLAEPMRTLIYDPADRRLLAVGMSIYVLGPAGWELQGATDDGHEHCVFDAQNRALVFFFEEDTGIEPKSVPMPGGPSALPIETMSARSSAVAQLPVHPSPSGDEGETTQAYRFCLDGESKPAKEVAAALGLDPAFDLLAVLVADEQAFPFRAGSALAVGMQYGDEAWERPADLPRATRWEESFIMEGEEEPPEWEVTEPADRYGLRIVPVESTVGWMMDIDASMSAEAECLRGYRLEPVVDVRETAAHRYDSSATSPSGGSTKLGGFPYFLQRAVRLFDKNGQPMKMAAQLSEDVFDCAFGDAGRLWLFLSEDGTQVDAEVQ